LPLYLIKFKLEKDNYFTSVVLRATYESLLAKQGLLLVFTTTC